MGFHIQPLQEFLVRPQLPESLPRMTEIAYNVLWSWDHAVRAMFRRLDSKLWNEAEHNPILMLSRISPAQLAKSAADPRYVSAYRRACERFDAYMERYHMHPKQGLIAYFCMEFGVVQCMPIYSGGLGILAGDHLKAASDNGLPLVGVGLLYQKGYFRQSLNPDGWQQERTPVNDFYTLPVQPAQASDGSDIVIGIDIPGGTLFLKIWLMNAGGVKLILLDSNIPEFRNVTDQLYAGDKNSPHRLKQEIALGIGGVRALRALGLEPTVYHMNEGHSAFLALERIRLLMSEHGLNFREALEASRHNNVFTTHTSVPAGFDEFQPSILYEYFREFCDRSGIPFDWLLSLGRRRADNHSEPFSMAVSALTTSAYRNAVSVLHRDVSQEMFQDLWPQTPRQEVPITSVTNGVHVPSWVNGDLASLYDQYLQPDWQERQSDFRAWDGIDEIPDAELWEVHRRRKRQLVQFVRESARQSAIRRNASAAEVRRSGEVFDFEALTIGFSRRFATYKRATLIFRDIPRLKKILNNPEMPVQIVVAGKAHPKDEPGKRFIREVWNHSRDPELSRRLLFVEDYSIQVGRELTQGVDVWLNNPKRPEEACGTSGMKAGVNGVLNLLILDGWFDEAYEISGGWRIGEREPYTEDQDDLHASNIYSLLENDIVPMYYENRERGVPLEWMRRVKTSLACLSPRFNSGRMVGEYNDLLYRPAHEGWEAVSADNFAKARETVAWMDRVRSVWDRVRFVETPHFDHTTFSGRAIHLRVVMDLAGLQPRDVKVEIVFGSVTAEGTLENMEVIPLSPAAGNGEVHVFTASYAPTHTGRVGSAVRVSPNHSKTTLTRPCHALMKWA